MLSLKHFVSSLFINLIILGLSLLAPQSVQAQSVGSHLGEGDINTQISNIRILQANGAGAGFPVTALLNINTAGQNQSVMNDLAGAISDAGFFPIVRLTHVCEPFESGVTPGTAVNNVRAAFGADAIIVYGNEVNNREAECNDWSRYVNDFNSITNKNNVSPAALDYYMGNSAYTVDSFFNSTPGAREIYSSAGVNAANAYGCIGRTVDQCESPYEPNTQNMGFQSYSGTVYLTEFSLSPGGRAANAPDTDIEKVLDFIESKAAETGVGIITPLVRNVCNSEGEWLLHVNGRLFTTAGSEVTGDCEVSGAQNLSDYPDYGYNSEYYYLHPIKGIHPDSKPSGQNVSVARADLAAQGYEAYCAAEPSEIKLDMNTRELIDRFLDLYPQGIRNESRTSEYSLNSNSSQFPLFRDTTGKKFFTSSIEEFFGFKDVYNKSNNYSVRELRTAPINSLLSQEQKCIEGVRMLRDIQLMCERLDDPANCALLENEIPNTSYNVSSLLDDVADVIPGYRAGRIVEQCKMLFSNQIPEFANEDPEIPRVKNALLNVPLYLDRSFRLAFLVASIEQQPTTQAFNFFTFSEAAQPKHEVLMVAFKVPDILTNKGGGEESGHYFFTDAASQTRNVLVPERFQNSEDPQSPGYAMQTRERRSQVGTNATNATVQSSDSKIYCLDGAGNTPAELNSMLGSPACKDVLGKAVVDLINGNAQSCDNLESEPVREILQAASIIPPGRDHPSRIFDTEYGFGTDVLNYIFLNNDSPQEKESVFTTIFNIVGSNFTDNAQSQTAKVDFYLVYPVGYELESVTEVMKNSFFTASQIAELDEINQKTRFDTSGFSTNFDGGSLSHTFQEAVSSGECTEVIDFLRDPESGEVIVPVQEIITYDCSKSFDISIEEQGSGGVSVLGARLGYWLRNIQLALNKHYSGASLYIRSCNTMEQFLLGTCIRTSTADGGTDSGTDDGYGRSVANASCPDDPRINPRVGVWSGHGINAFPSPIQRVMRAAADQYNMPLCVLTAIASVEGSGMTQLSVAEAQALTRPWTRTPEQEISADLYDKVHCSPNFANAAGPMQMLPSSFNAHANASDEFLGPHRNSVCNATDAIFAAAEFLAEERLHLYGYGNPPTAEDWNQGRIYCAAGQTYYGWCRLDAPTCNNLGTNYCDFVLTHCKESQGLPTDAQCSQYSRFEQAETYQ